MKQTLKSCGLPDWNSQLLILGKDSLTIHHDQESCMFMTELSEFEQYIMSTYIHGLNMVEDLLSKLFEMGKPNNSSDSMGAIIEALNAFKTIKSKKIESKFTEVHLEKIVVDTLRQRDANEFRI